MALTLPQNVNGSVALQGLQAAGQQNAPAANTTPGFDINQFNSNLANSPYAALASLAGLLGGSLGTAAGNQTVEALGNFGQTLGQSIVLGQNANNLANNNALFNLALLQGLTGNQQGATSLAALQALTAGQQQGGAQPGASTTNQTAPVAPVPSIAGTGAAGAAAAGTQQVPQGYQEALNNIQRTLGF